MQLLNKISLLSDLLKCRFQPHLPHKRTGVLTLRLDRIGDFALYAPFAGAGCRENEPFILGCRPLWMELAKKVCYFDQYIPIEPDQLLNDRKYRRDLLHWVAAKHFHTVLQPRFYRELFVEELLALASGAKEEFRFEATAEHLQYPLLKLFQSKAVEIPANRGEHELLRNARFARQFGVDTVKNPWSSKPVPAPPEFRNEEYIVLCPGSGKGEHCCWPMAYWVKLIEKLDLHNIVISGSRSEAEYCGRLAEKLKGRARSCAGRYDLCASAGLISHARAVLGNDTGGIHLAAMSGIPSLVICGQGQPGWFLPYPAENPVPEVTAPVVVTTPVPCANCFWRCTHQTQGICDCIRAITVEQAAAAAAFLR